MTIHATGPYDTRACTECGDTVTAHPQYSSATSITYVLETDDRGLCAGCQWMQPTPTRTPDAIANDVITTVHNIARHHARVTRSEQQELAAVVQLHPRTGNVSNIVSIRKEAPATRTRPGA